MALALLVLGLGWAGQDASANRPDHAGLTATTNEIDGYVRSQARYRVPAVEMIDNLGKPASLAKLLEGDNPVMLNFIFTSCGAICPVMSATFAKVQADIGPAGKDLLLVSISIDPEQDTPLALRNYARYYGAGPRWKMLTGKASDSIAVQRAFDTYRGDKMNHAPVTFMRAHPGQPWVRIEGFANADDLIREYRKLAAK